MKYMLFLILALPLCAQTQIPRQLMPQVREYLQLTNAQVLGIVANNDEYNRKVQEKMQRIRQVQLEIADETARDPLDPMALGARYLEIELICRELRDAGLIIQKLNLEQLTDAQKAKLKALEEALRLVPVITEAQGANLLGGLIGPQGSFAGYGGGSSYNFGYLVGTSPIGGCVGTGILAPRPPQ